MFMSSVTVAATVAVLAVGAAGHLLAEVLGVGMPSPSMCR
jgi:hypothetical protein